jgi:hypothetical protein
MTPLEELQFMLTAACRSRGWKVLECGADVLVALHLVIPDAPPRKPWEPDLTFLTGVDIVLDPDSAPGNWRVVRHEACAVDDENRVSHGLCPVVAEGRLGQ